MALAITCLSLPVALAATRYRDLAPLIGNLTYLMFLVSPILWKEEQLAPRARFLLNFNPFVWIFRSVRPLMLGQLPAREHLVATAAAVVIAAPLCALLYRRTADKLAYWVH
jgi:ABC-type polysaccharide/polyol phosphate export permease